MHVIEVIPLQRGSHLESLSYFSSQNYPVGTFLKAPIRGKQIAAIVTDTKSVSNSKSSLRSASFSLRKLPEQAAIGAIPDSLIATAKALSEQMPTKVGAVLYQLLPPDIRHGNRSYPSFPAHVNSEDTTPLMLCGEHTERFVSYRAHIRTTLAHRGSILFVVPSSNDVVRAATELSHGIEERIVTFSAAQTKKQRDASYTAFEDNTTAKLIITTPGHAYLDRPDLLTVIIDQAASASFRTRTRPYLDHRDVLRFYAQATGRSIIFGDLVLRTEDEQYRRIERYGTYGEHPKRLSFPSPLSIIKQKDRPTVDAPFQLFSPDLQKTITTTLEARGRILLYSARRGLAPVVTCFDCGFIFRCPDSHTPYTLLRSYKHGAEERWFISSTSGKRVRAADICEQCGSWRLRERGIGIQHVVDEFKTLFPNAEPVVFDHTTATTHKRAAALADTFYTEKSSVLIGTPMCLPYLTRTIDLSAIVSLDATRAIPSWRADEELFTLLMKLRELSEKEVVVQTRTEPDDLLVYASRGSLERFYDDEIKLRTMLSYPPFSVFVLLSYKGSDAAIAKTNELLDMHLTPYQPIYYNNPASTPKKTLRHCLLRVPTAQWPHTALLTALKKLPPHISIQLNPDRIV